jgi:hypothetical protein
MFSSPLFVRGSPENPQVGLHEAELWGAFSMITPGLVDQGRGEIASSLNALAWLKNN